LPFFDFPQGALPLPQLFKNSSCINACADKRIKNQHTSSDNFYLAMFRSS
jgi:hypothetical protein